ncbi:hypothetical protein LCGC14_2137800 [marine sediment metagenome]|uniref:Uncharacterized protein n=1 Tax=marine sediment metagenome TaxID=412755 RepID=A0A0F9ELI4_9ZZZZ
MVEPTETPAPTDGGEPAPPETPVEAPADDPFAYLDKSQEELMEAIEEPTPPETPPVEPPPVEVPPVAEPPSPAEPPVAEPPPAAPPVAPPLTPAAPPVSVEEELKQARAQLASLTDQMNRMAGLDKIGAYDPPPPVPGAPLDPAVAPPAPGVYTPPMAPAAPPHAAVGPIITPTVTVAPEVMPQGFAEMAEPLTKISQTLVNQVYTDMDAKIDQKLDALVTSSRHVAQVHKRFYESYPALAPYKELVAQVAVPYEQHIISAPSQGLEASVYFHPIAQKAVAYLAAQGITVDPTHAPAVVPGSPATPPPVNPGAARATVPTGAARPGAGSALGDPTQNEYMSII